MRITTLGLVVLPVALGGIGMAAAMAVSDAPLFGNDRTDASVDARDGSRDATSTSLGVGDEVVDDISISGRRPFLSVSEGSRPFLPPGTVVGMLSLAIGATDRYIPAMPSTPGATPVAGRSPHLERTDDARTVAAPARNESAPHAHTAPGPAAAPAPGPASAPARPAAPEPAAAPNPPAAQPAAPNPPAAQPAAPNPPAAQPAGQPGRPAHAGETGRPAHAGTNGPPAHAAATGRPAHAGDSGRPAHAGDSGRPAHAGESGRPAHAGESGRPDHASGNGRSGRDSSPR